MAAAGPRHSRLRRTVQAAPPPAALSVRAAGGARPGPGLVARGRRERTAWDSAGPRRGACRAARISWAREAGLEDRSLHRRVCAATRGASRVSPALRARGVQGAHPRVGASGGRKMVALPDSAACFGFRADRGKP
ncbi:hypothetical protein NN561_007466 [Cricetulus griseus]